MNQFDALLMMGQSGEGGGGWQQFIPLILIILVFYFFMIRPQVKKQKQQKKFKESLSKGDKIVTIGGIHGKILELKENTATLDIGGGNKVKVERSAISMEFTGQVESGDDSGKES